MDGALPVVLYLHPPLLVGNQTHSPQSYSFLSIFESVKSVFAAATLSVSGLTRWRSEDESSSLLVNDFKVCVVVLEYQQHNQNEYLK